MIARLRELGAPIYGAKAQKWARVLKAENKAAKEEEIQELLKERQTRRREAGEAYVPTLLPAPKAPTDLERFTHELSHCPPAPWCEICVMGKMQDRPHRARTLEDRERGLPEVQADYMFMDSEMRIVPKSEAWTTILCVVDVDSSTPKPICIPTKSPDLDHTTNNVLKFIKRLCHNSIQFKTDGEPSVKILADKILTGRLPLKTHVKHTPRYSSPPLGAVGVMQKLVQGQVRTLKSELEAKYGMHIKPEDVVWPWLVRHTAWVIERMHTKQSGHPAFRDTTGEWYKGELVPCGETVLFRHARSKSGRKPLGKRQQKADARFDRGIFLGKSEETDGYIIGAKEYGVLTARTAKRLEPSKQHDREMMARIIGVPWDKSMGKSVRKYIDSGQPYVPASSAPVAADAEEAQEAPRRPIPMTTKPEIPEEGAPSTSSSSPRSTIPLTSQVVMQDKRSYEELSSEERRALKQAKVPEKVEATRGAQAMPMDTSSIVVPELMQQWRKREGSQDKVVEEETQKVKKAKADEGMTMIIAAGERADNTGNKEVLMSEFTCDDYNDNATDTDWWSQDNDHSSGSDDKWEQEYADVKPEDKTEEELELEGMWEEINLLKKFKVFVPKSLDELKDHKFLTQHRR